jgi:hypothetical protein
VLSALAAAAAGTAVLSATRPGVVQAGTDGDVVLGSANSTTSTTGVLNTFSGTAFESTFVAQRGPANAFPPIEGYGANAALVGDAETAEGSNTGVWGIASGARGVGVYGQSDSPSGSGLRGYNGGSGPAVVGDNSVAGFGIGVQGLTNSSTHAGVEGDNTSSSGVGVLGNGGLFGIEGTSSTTGVAGGGTSTGVFGVTSNGTGTGVFGSSTSGAGIYGGSSTGNAVYGTNSTPATGQPAILGVNSGGGPSVMGSSTGSGIGVSGSTNSSTGGSPAVQGVNGGSGPGVVGFSSTGTGVGGGTGSGIGFGGVADTGNGVQGQSTSGIAVEGVAIGATGFSGYFTGGQGMAVNGNFTAMGGHKSAAVRGKDGTLVRLYCVESPESWFEDFGGAQLSNGAATVQLEPGFAAVVKTDAYHVFLTPQGESKGWLYVSSKTPNGFAVHEAGGGTSNVAFDYRVVARRKDVTGARLEHVDEPPAVHLLTLPELPATPPTPPMPPTPAVPTPPSQAH